MKTMWVGFHLTEKQFKTLIKKHKEKDGIKICPSGFTHTEFMGRRFQMKDIVLGPITPHTTEDNLMKVFYGIY